MSDAYSDLPLERLRKFGWSDEDAQGLDFEGEPIINRGGPGSGHFGHEGRPGQRGGSLPGEGGGERRYKVERPVRFGPEEEMDQRGWKGVDQAHAYGLASRTGHLNAEEQHRLKQYVGSFYHVVNTALREGQLPGGAREFAKEWNEQLTTMIEAMDRITTENGALDQPTTLWRGINRETFAKMRPGRTFTDPAYVSTSMTGAIFRWDETFKEWDFVGDRGAFPIAARVEIDVPAGTTGYYVGNRGPKEEWEFILPRDLTFRVDEVDRKNFTAKLTVVPR